MKIEKHDENECVLPEQFIYVVLFVDSRWPIECEFTQSCVNGTIHLFNHIRNDEKTRSIEAMRTMHTNVFQWMLFHKCINNFDEGLRLFDGRCFAVTTAFQFEILTITAFNIASIIKTCGVSQINPKSELLLNIIKTNGTSDRDEKQIEILQ